MGTMKKHLKSLGFHTVYNECEDFYALIREGRVPPHDVLVTNPPYSRGHAQRLLHFCNAHDKPYFLLLPDYVCEESEGHHYNGKVSGNNACDVNQQRRRWKKRCRTDGPVYLCPEERYSYWT